MHLEQDEGWFSVPASHPVLVGHFLGRPLVPGALVLEAVVALAGGGVSGVHNAKFLARWALMSAPTSPSPATVWT